MKRVTLVALKRDRGGIMNLLAKLGVSEIADSGDYESTRYHFDANALEPVDKKLGKLNFALEFLKNSDKEIAKESKNLPKNTIPKYTVSFSRENKLTDYSELLELTRSDYDLFSKIDHLEKINSELTDIKAEGVKLSNLIAQVSEYSALDIKFSEIKSTEKAFVCVGIIPEPSAEGIEEKLPEDAIFRSHTSEKSLLVSVISSRESEAAVMEVLVSYGFIKCPYDFDKTPGQVIEESKAKIEKGKARRIELLAVIAGSMKHVDDFKNLFDYYTIEKEKIVSTTLSRVTGSTFVMDFWTPADLADYTVREIKKIAPTSEMEINEPKEGEVPPTLVREPAIVRPFSDSITSTFGFPIYGGMDPNPFVAFFFFLFFGFMLSDAGYGVVMTLGCFGYLLVKRPVKHSGSFITMLGLCGISTIFWGAIFGGWFAISAETLSSNAFGRFLLSLKCIDPLDGQQTLIMFGLALGLGVLQLGVGFLLGGIDKLKHKDLGGALGDLAWVGIFVGAAVFLVTLLVNVPAVKYIGLVILGLGVAALLVGGAIGKKNPLKMIVGSLKNVYGAVSVFSDILSYARLFGLGLCTGVIGMVFNKLGMLFVNSAGALGYIPAVVIWVVGHSFNIAINTLGVYVHNSRLQFVEFFGKFFEGGGRAFAPLGSKTKYTFLADKITTDEIAAREARMNKIKLKLRLSK